MDGASPSDPGGPTSIVSSGSIFSVYLLPHIFTVGSGLVASGELTPMSDEAGRVEDAWASHLNHNQELSACDLLFTAGGCRVREWTLLGSRDDLVGGRLPSDHRALVATVGLDAPAAVQG